MKWQFSANHHFELLILKIILYTKVLLARDDGWSERLHLYTMASLAWDFFSTQTEPKPFFISDNMGSLHFAC